LQQPTTSDDVHGGLVNSVNIRWLFESPSVSFCRWRCCVSHPGLTEERFQPWHVIAFSHCGSYQMHTPEGTAFVDANTMCFFNGRGPYRTSHPNSCGDHGSSMMVAPGVLTDALAAFDRRTLDHAEAPFVRLTAPSPPSVYFRLRVLLSWLQRQDAVDPLQLEETGLRLLEAIAPLATARIEPEASGPPRACLEKVEWARILLERRCREALRLNDLARAVELSPFHLCRSFRRVTGITIHRYLLRLRLREALDRVADGAPDLTAVALDTGFSARPQAACVTPASRAARGEELDAQDRKTVGVERTRGSYARESPIACQAL
jgi:AraC-like DNA-binding protein